MGSVLGGWDFRVRVYDLQWPYKPKPQKLNPKNAIPSVFFQKMHLKGAFVVYFDKSLGAAHSERWSK